MKVIALPEFLSSMKKVQAYLCEEDKKWGTDRVYLLECSIYEEIEFIKVHPTSRPEILRGMRRCTLGNSEYYFIYEYEKSEETITLHKICHYKQKI